MISLGGDNELFRVSMKFAIYLLTGVYTFQIYSSPGGGGGFFWWFGTVWRNGTSKGYFFILVDIVYPKFHCFPWELFISSYSVINPIKTWISKGEWMVFGENIHPFRLIWFLLLFYVQLKDIILKVQSYYRRIKLIGVFINPIPAGVHENHDTLGAGVNLTF